MYYGPSRQRVADFCVLSNKAKTEDTKNNNMLQIWKKGIAIMIIIAFRTHMSYEKAIVESFYYNNKIFHGLSYGKKV